MVLDFLRECLCDRFGCEEDTVYLSASFDELNIRFGELAELAMLINERFGVDIPDDALESFTWVEDMVGYTEDHL